MKTLLKGAFFTAAAAFMFTSCNKDQAAVNKMEGEWKVKTSKTYLNGTEVQPAEGEETPDMTLTFEKCKLADAEWCDASMAVSFDGASITTDFKYNVSNDGESMSWDMDNNAATTEDRINATINKVSKKEIDFYYTETEGSDTYRYEIVLEPK